MNRFLIISIVLIAISCRKEKYEIGHFRETVTNFGEVNTEFDDYNSTAPFIYYQYLFHFSSNRNSSGNDYDIVGENMYIDWSKTNGTLEIGTDLDDDRFDYLVPMFDSINTSCNELGPYSLGYRQDISYTEVLWTDLLLYSSDCNGNYDIKFIYSELYNNSDTIVTEIKPVKDLDFINTDKNELYPSFYGIDYYEVDEYGLDVSKIEKLIYCSDIEGVYNIYEVDFSSDSTLVQSLIENTATEPQKLLINSNYDDKCPFINGKLLVFASNRAGGYGGYDLYYSLNKNGVWSVPINFGESVNSEYDEYRPIVLRFWKFDNNLMIFSSNRPGGKGGFDLYHVGIKQLIE